MNGPDLASRIRRERDGLAEHLPAAREGDVNGVHRARVASRRLRELLPIAEAALDSRQAGLRRDLRRVTRALGPVRELDVTRDLLAAEAKSRRWPARIVSRVDRHCARARDSRRTDMLARLERGGASDLPRRLSALASLLEAGADEARSGAVLASRLRQRARTMSDAIAAVGTMYVPPALHAVRIAGKKLRYTLEIGKDTAGLTTGVLLNELKALQELLGGLNDRQILQQWLQTAASEPGVSPSTIHVLDDCQVAIEADCRERHAAFLRRSERLGQLVEIAGRDVVFGMVPARPERMPDADAGASSTRRRRPNASGNATS